MSTSTHCISDEEFDMDSGVSEDRALILKDTVKQHIILSDKNQNPSMSDEAESTSTNVIQDPTTNMPFQNQNVKVSQNMLDAPDNYQCNFYDPQVAQQTGPWQTQMWGQPQMAPMNYLPFPDGSGNIPLPNTEQVQPPMFSQTGSASHMAIPQTMPTASSYPTVYVAAGGLITVLLKHDVAVELTLDKTIRVVNHRHKAVAATNARGSMNSVYHVAAKIFQEGTKTEAELFGERRARMRGGSSGGENMVFSSGLECYVLDEDHIVPSVYCFSDMSRDLSVNVLFSASGIIANGWDTESVMARCDEVARNAKYYYHKNGSTTTIINNIKIHQDEAGDVQVTCGPKYISTSPTHGSILVQTHFAEISVQINWCVRVKRGRQMLSANYTHFSVSNGKHEAGFDEYRTVFSRPYNPTTTEFNSWIPSLALLPQAPIAPVPQTPCRFKKSSADDSSDSIKDYHKM